MLPSIIAISGSPSISSKTALLAELVLRQASESDAARHFRVSSVPPAALLNGDLQDPILAQMVDAVANAHGIIIATPIFKASYSGLLKAFLDLLPQFALAGTAVMPIATGGSLAHALALDYALRPVLQSMGARHVIQSHLVVEQQMTLCAGGLQLDMASSEALRHAVEHFRHTLTTDPKARNMGHPRPPNSGGIGGSSPSLSGE